MKNNKIFKISFFACVLLLIAYICSATIQKEEQIHQPFFDVIPGNKASYIYAPGMMCTELLMGRYCPSFIAATGEKVKWQSGGHVIGQPHTAVVFAEIDLHKPSVFTFNPFIAYINGLRNDLFPFIQRIFQDCFKFSVEDNPDSSKSIVSYSFKLLQANLGQKKDIELMHKAYHDHLNKYPDTDIVLFGDSRGAASIFNFLAFYQPTKIKAAVVEGIYDDVPHCIKHFIYDDKDERCEQRLHDLLALFLGSYSKKGPFARQAAEKITDDVPLLLVTSLKDGLVNPQCTIYLYNRLRERGHKKVHLLVLKTALHPCYMIDNPEDRNLYESAVHAFYKHYGLPHNKEKAEMGSSAFEATQPTAQEIKKLYNLSTCNYCL
jgi:hypothetical protein